MNMNCAHLGRLICFSLLALVVACRPFGRSATASSKVLHVGNGAEPSSLDPHAVNGVPEATILLSLFEGLLVPDPKTAEPCPGAASSWYISPDGLRYVFNLRENLRWSNGDPLVAKDFVYTFRRAISPKMGNPWVSFYYNVRNAEAYATGKIGDFSDVGIRAIDDLTLEIILERPVVYFLELLAHVAWLPVHRDTIEKFGALDERDTRWIRPGNMVCNGPFMLKSWENGNYILVVKNPHYWDKDNVALEKIYFHAVSDSATEERMYAAGDLDISSGLHVSKRPHYAKKGELHIDPYMGCAWVAVNCQRPPFNDPRIRKALALAINREEVNKIRGFGKDINAYGAVPPDVHHYRSIKQGFQEDVQEARRLLAEAGYPGGKGFPKTEVLYNFSDQHHLVFEVLQSMWERNLGIHVDLVSQEWKVYLSMMGRGDFTLGRHCWVGDYNDPMTMLEIFEGGSANNYTAWASTQYDYYLHQARNTANEEKRIGFLQEAERIFVKEMPAIPLFWMNSIHLVSPRVKGWYPNVMDVHLWKGISKSKD